MSKYEKLEVLGEGTYGKVYKVKRTSDGSLFAMKTYRSVNEQTQDEYPRIADVNEIDILCRFQHPNLLHCEDCFYEESSNEVCVILPLANQTLSDYVKSKGGSGLSVGKCKSVLFQLGSALHFMHVMNIYHCDIKPDNILLHNSEILLADFGLSYPNSLQGEGMRCGTLGYSSPQVGTTLRGGIDAATDVDAGLDMLRKVAAEKGDSYVRSDVFSLGMVLFFCLTGKGIAKTYDIFWKDYAHAPETIEMAISSRRATISQSELKDFDALVQICKGACQLSQVNRPSLKQILGNAVFSGQEPIPGKVIQVTLGAIPTDILGYPFDKFINNIMGRFLFPLMNNQRNPLHVFCLTLELYIRSVKLINSKKAMLVYLAAAAYCADNLVNSNSMLSPQDLVWASARNFTEQDLETSIPKMIGHLKGRLTTETFVTKESDAFVTIFYIFQIINNATKTFHMAVGDIELMYDQSSIRQNHALDYSKIKTVTFAEVIARARVYIRDGLPVDLELK